MIQTFTTTTAACVFPVVLCSVLTFLMVLTSYDWWRFFLVTVITLVLNQTWIAVYMMIIYANPSNACHATLMVAILAGFASGFVVTQEQMPIGLVSSVLKLVFSSQGGLPRRWEERPWEREWEQGCRVVHCNDLLRAIDNLRLYFFFADSICCSTSIPSCTASLLLPKSCYGMFISGASLNPL